MLVKLWYRHSIPWIETEISHVSAVTRPDKTLLVKRNVTRDISAMPFTRNEERKKGEESNNYTCVTRTAPEILTLVVKSISVM